MSSKPRIIFLDRDGTLNYDPGYLNDPEQLRLIHGVPEALQRLKDAGFHLVVVSNQSGVNRGLVSVENLQLIHERLNEFIAPAKIDLFQLCFHKQAENCECRKPSPKLLLEAATAIGADLSECFMIGDRRIDLEAGRNAGCRASILVLTGDGQATLNELEKSKSAVAPDFTASSLVEAADWILGSRT